MGFPRHEYWSGLPFPFAGDLPDPGTEPMSPATAGGFFTTEPPRKSKDLAHGEGNGYTPPVSLLGEFHGQRSLAGYVHGVSKGWTRLND